MVGVIRRGSHKIVNGQSAVIKNHQNWDYVITLKIKSILKTETRVHRIIDRNDKQELLMNVKLNAVTDGIQDIFDFQTLITNNWDITHKIFIGIYHCFVNGFLPMHILMIAPAYYACRYFCILQTAKLEVCHAYLNGLCSHSVC